MNSEIKKTKEAKTRRIALNLLDWMIIIAILLCGAGIWLRYGIGQSWQTKRETVSAKISFSVSNIRASSYDCFTEGAAVYNLDADRALIGYFAGSDEFSSEPAKYYEYSKTGEIVEMYSVSDRIDLNGIINAEGVKREDGFYCGGNTYIAPGQTITVTTRDIKVVILVTNIDIVTGNGS